MFRQYIFIFVNLYQNAYINACSSNASTRGCVSTSKHYTGQPPLLRPALQHWSCVKNPSHTKRRDYLLLTGASHVQSTPTCFFSSSAQILYPCRQLNKGKLAPVCWNVPGTAASIPAYAQRTNRQGKRQTAGTQVSHAFQTNLANTKASISVTVLQHIHAGKESEQQAWYSHVRGEP